MTTTNKLRCLLDERDVEYETADTDTYKFTRWRNGEIDAAWDDAKNWEQPHLLVIGITPTQAIAATLGDIDAETCHIDLVGYNQHEDRFQCRSCDWSMWFKHGTGPQFNFCPNCGRKVVN